MRARQCVGPARRLLSGGRGLRWNGRLVCRLILILLRRARGRPSGLRLQLGRRPERLWREELRRDLRWRLGGRRRAMLLRRRRRCRHSGRRIRNSAADDSRRLHGLRLRNHGARLAFGTRIRARRRSRFPSRRFPSQGAVDRKHREAADHAAENRGAGDHG